MGLQYSTACEELMVEKKVVTEPPCTHTQSSYELAIMYLVPAREGTAPQHRRRGARGRPRGRPTQ